MARGYPMGFRNKEQFEQCMQSLCAAVANSGISCSSVGVRGTAATFNSNNPYKPGHYFDKKGKGTSDLDVFFVTDERLACAPSAAKFFHPDKIESNYPKIAEWSEEWTGTLGRETTAGAFKSSALALGEDHIAYTCEGS